MAKEKPREAKISPEQLITIYQNQRASMDGLLQQEGMLQSAFQEIVGAEEALKEIDAGEKNTSVLFLLGSGVFVEAELKDKKVKSEIGGGVVQKTSIKKALEQLAKKKESIASNLEKLQKRKQETAAGLARMEQLLNEFRMAVDGKKHGAQSVS